MGASTIYDQFGRPFEVELQPVSHAPKVQEPFDQPGEKNGLLLGLAGLFFAGAVIVMGIGAAIAEDEQDSWKLSDLSHEDADYIGVFQLPVVTTLMAIASSLLTISVVAYLSYSVLLEERGTKTMVRIGGDIADGARAFLSAEYKPLVVFLIIMAVVIGLATESVEFAVCYGFGGLLSGLTGYIGMNIAVRGNIRTAAAANKSLSAALKVAFKSGAVMGLSVVGFGLLGISCMYLLFQDVRALAGFGAGASTIALFARVGGGIYTKAADVGADLVGKVENDIPEDDPRNPATIADNVGDNVGDVAGMGADLFESYVGSIAAATVLGAKAYGEAGVALPLWIGTVGVIAGIIGCLYIHTPENATMEQLLSTMRRNVMIAAVIIIAGVAGVIFPMFDDDNMFDRSVLDTIPGVNDDLTVAWRLFLAIILGLVVGVLIGMATEYFTSHTERPTRSIAEAAEFGAGPVIIQGLGQGMLSTVIPLCLIVIAILGAYELGSFDGKFRDGGNYAVAIASVGMLSTLGVTMSTDAYGPVADNAGGIAEMAELESVVRDRTDRLDALGNTTAATGKGFANGSAVLSAVSLLAAYTTEAELNVIDLQDAYVVAALLIGALLPYVFAALTMLAVGRSAQSMILEVRRQFADVPGLREGRPGAVADHARCVDISTAAALREMILPGAIAITSPLIIGFCFGSVALAGLLIGAIASGYLLGVMMSNAGGAWDNAKKYIEAGGTPGHGKGSEWHKAAVSGDTVGDPFKDTSGPALNILIKLTTRFSFVFATTFAATSWDDDKYWIGLVIAAASIIIIGGGVMWLNTKVEAEAAKERARLDGLRNQKVM